MTALILVVDDVPANVKLLEVKLTQEYYDVITARDGYEALEKAKKHKPDLILLDVMMPGMDGFETCRRLKEDIEVSHIPVVMVTALNEASDRVVGLESGADDFLTKPINDVALLARVRSLVRIKVLLDELRLRDQTVTQMGVAAINNFTSDVSGSKIVLIDDDVVQIKRITERLETSYTIELVDQIPNAVGVVQRMADTDLIMISTLLSEANGLRIAAHLRNVESLRHVPILMLVDEEDRQIMLKGFELGINDYLLLPIDQNEMAARVKTQIRRKKFQDALKANYQTSVSLAITDRLTGLYNRHYLEAHIENTVTSALNSGKPLSVIMIDMDHFKEVNDTYMHENGDLVLKQLSKLIIGAVRSSDLAARLGGEEFVILMPDATMQAANRLAERIRVLVEQTEFVLNHPVGSIRKTISLGVSTAENLTDTGAILLRRADHALYVSKNSGRNRVSPRIDEEGAVTMPELEQTGF